MKYLFAPGCALFLYKPHLITQLHEVDGRTTVLYIIPEGTHVINICPGCDRRYRENYANPATVSLWELLSESDAFPFPDYKLEKMTIIDACPTRKQDRIHRAVRAVAKRMNITIVEPAHTRTQSTCCGDSCYGEIPTDKVIKQMKKKAGEMPLENILVYCVSCSKSMFIGEKRPRYLVDLLFGEDTVPQTIDPDQWHKQIDEFRDAHKDYEALSSL